MDGDGDLDIVSASDNDDTIAWYENDGAADFMGGGRHLHQCRRCPFGLRCRHGRRRRPRHRLSISKLTTPSPGTRTTAQPTPHGRRPTSPPMPTALLQCTSPTWTATATSTSSRHLGSTTPSPGTRTERCCNGMTDVTGATCSISPPFQPGCPSTAARAPSAARRRSRRATRPTRSPPSSAV